MARDAVNESIRRVHETQHPVAGVDTSISSRFNSYTPRTSGSGINLDTFYRAGANASRTSESGINLDTFYRANANASRTSGSGINLDTFYRANANASRTSGSGTNMDTSHGADANTSKVDEPSRTSEYFSRNRDRSCYRSSYASAFPGDTSSFQSRASTSSGTGDTFSCDTDAHTSFAGHSTGRQHRHRAPQRSNQDYHKTSQNNDHTFSHEGKARTHVEELSKNLRGRKERLDTMYRKEEERVKQEAAREREERRKRLDEANRREEQRIKREEDRKVSARSNTSEMPSAVRTPAACTQAASVQDKEIKNDEMSSVTASANISTPNAESHAATQLGNQEVVSAMNRPASRRKNETFNVPAIPVTAPSASRDASSAAAPSTSHVVSSAVSISKAQEEEDRKMPASILGKEQQVQERIKAYIARWQEAKPSERLTLQSEDKAMLEQLEALKKDTKREYRKHMMGVDAPDYVDPSVRNESFQSLRTIKAQLNELRSMRSELIEKLQPTETELRAAGMDVARNEAQEKVCYSSDEDESPFPPRGKDDRKKVAKPVFQAYAAKQMQISQKGVVAITVHEGFREKVYKVGGRGNNTIGYGHEVLREEEEEFSQGITKDQALDLLDKDVQAAIKDVRARVKVPLKQYQLDALVSYVYNTGSLFNSPKLLKKLNAGDFIGAAREMDVITQGRKVTLPGLVKRREVEQKLFLYGHDK